MRLTNRLKKTIVRQFKDGASMTYLAGLYEQKLPRFEQTIRFEMIRAGEEMASLESSVLSPELSDPKNIEA